MSTQETMKPILDVFAESTRAVLDGRIRELAEEAAQLHYDCRPDEEGQVRERLANLLSNRAALGDPFEADRRKVAAIFSSAGAWWNAPTWAIKVEYHLGLYDRGEQSEADTHGAVDELWAYAARKRGKR